MGLRTVVFETMRSFSIEVAGEKIGKKKVVLAQNLDNST